MSRPGPARLLRILRRLTVALVLVLLVAWLTGRIVSDRFGWSQWLLWIPTPAALLGAVVGLLAMWSGPRGRVDRAAWGLVIAALLLHFLLVEHRFLARSVPARDPTIRLVNGNVLPLAEGKMAGVVDVLAALGGDLLILSSPIAPKRLGQLTERLGEPEQVVLNWPFAIVSRLPLVEARSLVAGSGIRIVLLGLEVPGLDRPLVVYAVDLPSDPRLPRMEIARTARRLLDQAGGPAPDLVVGDFNMTRGSAALHLMFPDLTHAYDQAGRGYGATFRRGFPLYHLDHVLLADTLRATEYRLVDPKVGRHKVQVVEVVTGDG